MSTFSGKRVVVTGGTGGLGRAVVELLLERGAQVVVADHHPPRPGAANEQVAYVTLDAASEQSVSAFFEGLGTAPDAMVNTIGGYAAGDPVCDLDLGVLNQQLALNLVTATLLTKWAVRGMAKAGGGRIVHVASRAGAQSGAKSFAYSVSKRGVIQLCEAVAEESRKDGISINCVLPSIIDTPANRAAMPSAAFDTWPKPLQVAKVIAFLASEDAVLISGAAIPVYGKA